MLWPFWKLGAFVLRKYALLGGKEKWLRRLVPFLQSVSDQEFLEFFGARRHDPVVYMLVGQKAGCFYIGSTKCFYKRMYQHVRSVLVATARKQLVHKTMARIGLQHFFFMPFVPCSAGFLLRIESKLIKLLQPKLNMEFTADCMTCAAQNQSVECVSYKQSGKGRALRKWRARVPGKRLLVSKFVREDGWVSHSLGELLAGSEDRCDWRVMARIGTCHMDERNFLRQNYGDTVVSMPSLGLHSVELKYALSTLRAACGIIEVVVHKVVRQQIETSAHEMLRLLLRQPGSVKALYMLSLDSLFKLFLEAKKWKEKRCRKVLKSIVQKVVRRKCGVSLEHRMIVKLPFGADHGKGLAKAWLSSILKAWDIPVNMKLYMWKKARVVVKKGRSVGDVILNYRKIVKSVSFVKLCEESASDEVYGWKADDIEVPGFAQRICGLHTDFVIQNAAMSSATTKRIVYSEVKKVMDQCKVSEETVGGEWFSVENNGVSILTKQLNEVSIDAQLLSWWWQRYKGVKTFMNHVKTLCDAYERDSMHVTLCTQLQSICFEGMPFLLVQYQSSPWVLNPDYLVHMTLRKEDVEVGCVLDHGGWNMSGFHAVNELNYAFIMDEVMKGANLTYEPVVHMMLVPDTCNVVCGMKVAWFDPCMFEVTTHSRLLKKWKGWKPRHGWWLVCVYNDEGYRQLGNVNWDRLKYHVIEAYRQCCWYGPDWSMDSVRVNCGSGLKLSESMDIPLGKLRIGEVCLNEMVKADLCSGYELGDVKHEVECGSTKRDLECTKIWLEDKVVSILDKNNKVVFIEPISSYANRMKRTFLDDVHYERVCCDEDEILKQCVGMFVKNSWNRLCSVQGGRLSHAYVLPKNKDPIGKDRPIIPSTRHPLRRLLNMAGRAWIFILSKVRLKHFNILATKDLKMFAQCVDRWATDGFGDVVGVTFDVKNMYTELDHSDILRALDWILEKFGKKSVVVKKLGRRGVSYGPNRDKKLAVTLPMAELRRMAEYELKNMYFRVGNDVILQQVKGVAMGGFQSPGMAMIVAAYSEYCWLSSLGKDSRLVVGVRYMDDAFILAKGYKKYQIIESLFSKCYPKSLELECTGFGSKFQILECEVSFVDNRFALTHYNKNSKQVWLLGSQSIKKFIPWNSGHRKHMLVKVLIGLLHRIWQNTHTSNLYDMVGQLLSYRIELEKLGYPRWALSSAVGRFLAHSRISQQVDYDDWSRFWKILLKIPLGDQVANMDCGKLV